MSLDDKLGKERDKPISDFLVDASCTSPEDSLIKRESTNLVSEAMQHLTHQEKTVICHRFGILTGRAVTLKEIGEIMSISRERVRQIECQAKTRLRKLFVRKRLVSSPPHGPCPAPRGARPVPEVR